VQPELASENQSGDLLHPYLTGVRELEGRTGRETAVGNREDDRFKERTILRVERAVDEDLILVQRFGRASYLRTGAVFRSLRFGARILIVALSLSAMTFLMAAAT
jgi:hypothetical protein